jgi:hypothetical protein
MIGQYLADRRSGMRDREARREGFRISNYEIQRSALLELQEVIVTLNKQFPSAFTAARFGDAIEAMFPGTGDITHWYQMRTLLPDVEELLMEGGALVSEQRRPGGVPEERKIEIATRLHEVSERLNSIPGRFEPIMKHLDEVTGSIDRIKILEARAGSKKVSESCQKLIRMVNDWSKAANAGESEQRARDIKHQIDETLDATGDALRQGPFS